MTLNNDSEMSKSTDPSQTKKTWKREVAFIMLVALLFFGYRESIQVLEILTTPFTIFIAWSYGLDWTGKNAESIGKIRGFTSRDNHSYGDGGLLDNSPIGFESRYRGGYRQGDFSRSPSWEDEYETDRRQTGNIR